MSYRSRTADRLAALADLLADEYADTDRRVREWALAPTTSGGVGRPTGTHADPTSTTRPNQFADLARRWAAGLRRLNTMVLHVDARAGNHPAAMARSLADGVRSGVVCDRDLKPANHIVEMLEHVIWEATPLPASVAHDILAGADLASPLPTCLACSTTITSRTRSRLCEPCRNYRKVLTSRDPLAHDDAHFITRVRSGIESGLIKRPDSPITARPPDRGTTAGSACGP